MSYDELMKLTLILLGQNKVLSQCLAEGAKSTGATQDQIERFYTEVHESMDRHGLLTDLVLKKDLENFIVGADKI